MARYGARMTSQAAQLASVNAGTTVNGYIGAWTAGASAGFRLRRVKLGVITSTIGVPTSQQVSVALYRQTVLPVGTGLTNIAGQALESWTPADPTGGLTVTTAATIGTTGPTLAAQPLDVITFNTQSTTDTPWEFMEEIIVGSSTANGIAFVNIGNALPALHSINVSVEIEV
jgi:hypothetical protein